LHLWSQVCRAAADDADATKPVLDAAESLQVVYCQSWSYDDPAGRLAEQLGIDPAHRLYSGVGGTTPQLLVQSTADEIRRGALDLAVITGGEALETRRQMKKAAEKPAWSFPDPQRKPFPFEAPFHPAEVAHGVFPAWLTFPLFDIARRAHRRTDPTTYRRELGQLLAPMTHVAAANPYAWSRQPREADELITPTPGNRMVGYPYTKYMVSVMDVDMAAAVIMASHARANDLGVPAERRVYLRGSAYATEPVYVAEHERLWESPAMTKASRAALTNAGVSIDEVAHLDLYSCFGSSINLALDALGLKQDDPRGVTVTGGLPFAGGAGSNYLSHSLATMVRVLRNDPGSVGLVSGVGMHMTKHIVGAYSTTPPPKDSKDSQDSNQPDPTEPATTKTITNVVEPHTTGTVATYTVVHNRDGEREWGLVICDLKDGSRAYGRVDDSDLLQDMEENEWVGQTLCLSPKNDVNLARPPSWPPPGGARRTDRRAASPSGCRASAPGPP
jgi:acetyl-CoA C-acetyltransferase